MSEWFYLGLSAGDFAAEKAEGGVNVTTSPSPYDVPEAARIDVDQSHRRFSIEFQYIGSEPIRNVAEEPGISFRLGRNSGRLYGIDIEIPKISGLGSTVESLTGHIAKTIGGLAASSNLSARSINYQMVQQAVTSETETVLGNAGLLFS